MIAYPEEDVLIARGRYSTLNSEYRQQVERIMGPKGIVNLMRQHLLLASNGVQERPTQNRMNLDAMRACLGNFENAWNRIEELYDEMTVLKPMAWDGKTDE